MRESDLSSRWLGATVMAASDESFGEKENLLNPEPALHSPGRYGFRGEIVDGWETRRRREPGHDWALIRLGAPGAITSVDIDTSFFTGNFPEACRIDACGAEGYPSPAELADPSTEWIEIVPRSALRGNSHNVFKVENRQRFTHVRLSIFPDGGVARLRVLGQVIPDPRLLDGVSVDLLSPRLGGAVIASSDDFYTSAHLLIRPDQARTMGEGWETKRRRDGGNDYVVFRLGLAGCAQQLIVDTRHYKYNASAEIAVSASRSEQAVMDETAGWEPLLPRTRLQPDTYHVFPLAPRAAVSAIRLDAFPDGGLSRVRLIGTVDRAARRRAGYRWFNALPERQARTCLAGLGLSDDAASQVVRQRPLEAGAAGLEALKPLLEGSPT